ncbi:hypothetical protein CW740_01590 [Kangiella profundi]|uniref:Uncharacterized protein n=1 Tax=Kangiella profundi TaxID=1561924 RepID=A0A2K9AS66_9GAMM|nr:hypothetical protein [Kangiella profundi]AUD78001.1 hypothetical protein CW740_01590 [Kangiella profundi]GGE90741.1 hypothetical protein GCM10011356_01090 [Kangiella profundi]
MSQNLQLIETIANLTSEQSQSVSELTALGFEQELAEAIAQRDITKLESLLGANTNVSVILAPAEDDEDASEDDSREEEIKIA